MQTHNIAKGALMTLLAAGALSVAGGASAADSMGHAKTIKCYGVNAAYKNDCQSPGHSCAGQDAKARDPNAFVAMPAGLCAKVGGSTEPGKAAMMDKMGK